MTASASFTVRTVRPMRSAGVVSVQSSSTAPTARLHARRSDASRKLCVRRLTHQWSTARPFSISNKSLSVSGPLWATFSI